MLTLEYLRMILSYDKKTGKWRRLVARGNLPVGSEPGRVRDDGYRIIQIDGVKYKSNRLAWFYVKGAWPKKIVDHRDLDKANDRWSNLRPATGSQSSANIGAHADNQTGLKGVCRVRDNKQRPFKAQIMVRGIKNNIGNFATAAQAHAAYVAAAQKAFGEFARG